ncbi:CoA transferase [Phanerochaete sordida]|uniref:CoA transferase n=1 Tax=Phanerochaete sordida TaxID=48140 RepID=A0A9P3LAQ4_9APHY|nr:CoA transferase [Phanerochaete sordida]
MALDGVRVIEFAGLAPGPFAGLILADWGADVVRLDRVGAPSPDTLARHKRSVALDTKSAAGVALARRLIARADVLIDPFRPGVMERMGLGPDVFLGDGGLNRRLVFARLAGFAPKGPHRDMAGHDINYLALSGVLSMLPGTQDKPSFPLNLLADFGGGGMTCALGILLALIERSRSGLGQVISTDMVSGTRYLSTFPLSSALAPPLPGPSLFRVPSFPRSLPASAPDATPRMQHTLDGGAPFYNVYTCADDRWMSVGCLEPRFYAAFLERFLAALPENYVKENFGGWAPTLEQQFDREGEWPRLRRLFEDGFRMYGRDRWAKVFHGSDACAVPVLSPAEAGVLASNEEDRDGAAPAPHPLLSRTPARETAPARGLEHRSLLAPGAHTVEVLRQVLSLDDKEIEELRRNNVIGVPGEKPKL